MILKNYFTRDNYINSILILIILVGCALRFYNYYGWSLSNDELSALNRLRFPDFSTMIEQGVMMNDMHPAGVQSFLWELTNFAGSSPAVVRLPFVLFGCLSIPIFYLIAKEWFNKYSAILSTAVFATLEFPILYSQLARPYSPGLFFSLLTVYAWTFLIKRKSDQGFNKYHILFILSGSICMYIHYFSFLFVGLVGLVGLLFFRKKELLYYILSGLIMFILYIPSFKIFIYHFSIGGLGGAAGWLGPPSTNAIFQFLYYGLNESIVYIILLATILIFSFVKFRNQFELSRFHLIALFLSITPALIAYFYSIFLNPVFQYSILLFGFPFFVMFLFSFVNEKSIKYFSLVSVLLLIFGTYHTVIASHFYTKRYFAVFSDIAKQSINLTKNLDQRKVIKYINVIHPFYIHYYLQDHPEFKFDNYGVRTELDRNKFIHEVSDSSKDYFLLAWSNSFNDPTMHQIVRDHFPYVQEFHQYFNAGIYLYSKHPTKTMNLNPAIQFQFSTDFEKPILENDKDFIHQTTDAHSGIMVMMLDSTKEFSSTFRSSVLPMKLEKGTTVEFSVWVMGEDLKGLELVFSARKGDNNSFWRGAEASDYTIKSNTWQHAYLAYTITEDIDANDIFSAYLINKARKNIEIDDFTIRIIKYSEELE